MAEWPGRRNPWKSSAASRSAKWLFQVNAVGCKMTAVSAGVLTVSVSTCSIVKGYVVFMDVPRAFFYT